MSKQRNKHQYARPLLLKSLNDHDSAHLLDRLPLSMANDEGAVKFQEWPLQRLLHRQPLSLPIAELEPGFGRLVPIGMELPTPSGYVDNLFATIDGDLVVVECKLWRNPQARRRVLAQIIDYAQSLAQWRYEELDLAVRRSLGIDGKANDKALLDIMRAVTDDLDGIDESRFVDAVQRNLRLGRMLLLVVGDGIREDAESMADFLQQHAGFHFTLAMVETAIYKLPEGGFMVQPRVLARTLNIERAIVTIKVDAGSGQLSVTKAENDQPAASMTLTEESFFAKLEAADSQTALAFKRFIEEVKDLEVYAEVATKSAQLKWDSPLGKAYSLGGVTEQGKLTTYSVGWAPSAAGHLPLAHDYLSDLARVGDGELRRTKTAENWYVAASGGADKITLPPAISALSKASDWVDAIVRYQRRVREAAPDT